MTAEPLSFLASGIYVASTSAMGRGVFTSKSIKAGKLIELAPVIVMNEIDRSLLDQTRLHDYIFEWGDDEKKCIVALGLISMYNHSYNANCNYGMYFQQEAISIVAVRDIKAGEELFINYNGTWDDEKRVWFDKK